jgi:cytochrome b subunit of formate dehydrogenase
VHRVAHAVLMVSFLGLALTGLPLRYSNYPWAQTVSWALGGFASTGLWHRIFGVTNICCLVFYIMWFSALLIIGPNTGIGRIRFVFGPDSPVPNRRDLTDFAKMLRWFVGLGPKPTFERWTYWEKFDLWAASADIVLIGSTGLILWFPNQFCSLLPGQVLNIADLIHGKLALLATGFVFTIHFFNANLRPDKFPMDVSIFTGLVIEDELQEERPEFVQRLRNSGQLEQSLAESPSRRALAFAMLGGFLALSIGLALVVAIVAAML